MKAFSTAFTRGLPHGILAAVHLPEHPDEIPTKVLHRLHVDERSHAEGLTARRRVEWIGGRLAAKTAASALGVDLGALLSDEYGAPQAPKSLTISISHKNNLAIALVARRKHGLVGVDLEYFGRDRTHIAPKILTTREQADVESLVEERRWTAILLRFAIKEAIYKALAPRLQRYIAFDEAEISAIAEGEAKITLTLQEGVPPRKIEGRYDWLHEGLVASVRVHWD